MLNKNCSRCDKFTSVLEKGRLFNGEFLCSECLAKALEINEVELSSEKTNEKLQSVIAILSVINPIYLILSIIYLIIKIGYATDNNNLSGSVGLGVMCEALIIILVYFLIKGFILLLETVIKIYNNLTD